MPIFVAKLTPWGTPLRDGECSGVFISQVAHGAVHGAREKGAGDVDRGGIAHGLCLRMHIR